MYVNKTTQPCCTVRSSSMAFVHPSRRALIPQPSHPAPSTDRGRDRSHDRDRRDEDGQRRDRGGGFRDSRREEASTRRDHRSPIRSPVPRPTSGRESPKYDDYSRRDSSPPSNRKSDDTRPRSIPPSLPSVGESKRPETTPENGHPWRQQQENMYRRDSGFDGGGDYFERCAAFLLQSPGKKFSLSFAQATSTASQQHFQHLAAIPSRPYSGAVRLPCFFYGVSAHLVDLVHRSATRVREANTNDVALPPFPLRQRIAKRNGGVVREKNASGRGREECDESGSIGARKLTRVMTSASIIATAKQNRPHRQTTILVKRDHDPVALVPNSPATKTSGWRSLRLLVHLSPPYLVPPPLQAFHRPLHLGPPRGRPMTVTRLTGK